MDSGKLPNYRSSYLFRFHPYVRVKPSAHERVMTALCSADDDVLLSDGRFIPSHQTAVLDCNAPNVIARNLDEALNLTNSVHAAPRKLSMSTLVVDLALLMCPEPSPTAYP